MPNVRLDGTRTDEDLKLELARGQQDALRPLYSRYARLVFNLSAQSLGRAAAEELVQEVFLTIWRGAGDFDAAQGPFRPWLLRLTHWKILNELRRRRRRPPSSLAAATTPTPVSSTCGMPSQAPRSAPGKTSRARCCGAPCRGCHPSSARRSRWHTWTI